MVGNDKQVYMVHPVQSKQDKYDYDPWTIGQVLGFLHEVRGVCGLLRVQ